MTVRLRFVFAILAVAAIARMWMYEAPYQLPPEVIHTREPVLIIPPRPQPAEDLGMMPLLALTLLQAPSGLQINGEIPLWGVLIALFAAVGAFFAIRQRMDNHETRDDERFGSVNAMLKEIRDDVKRLIGDHASGD